MRLAFAMLADAATVADGKLYVHGGGWSYLIVDDVPTHYPSFALVFVLEMNGSEAPGRIPLDLEVVAGESAVASVRGWLEVPGGDAGAAGTPALVTNHMTFANVPLSQLGPYAVRIASEGEELGRVNLQVVRRDESSSV